MIGCPLRECLDSLAFTSTSAASALSVWTCFVACTLAALALRRIQRLFLNTPECPLYGVELVISGLHKDSRWRETFSSSAVLSFLSRIITFVEVSDFILNGPL